MYLLAKIFTPLKIHFYKLGASQILYDTVYTRTFSFLVLALLYALW